MSDVPNSSQKIQIEGVTQRGPVSESVAQAIGGAVNYLLDETATNTTNITNLQTTVGNKLDNLVYAEGGESSFFHSIPVSGSESGSVIWVTVTTGNRRVMVGLKGSNDSAVGVENSGDSSAAGAGIFKIYRDGFLIHGSRFHKPEGSSDGGISCVGPGAIFTFDAPGAGTHTYYLSLQNLSDEPQKAYPFFKNCRMFVCELPI